MVTVIGDEAASSTQYRTLAAVEMYFDEDSVTGPSTLLREFFDSLSELKADLDSPCGTGGAAGRPADRLGQPDRRRPHHHPGPHPGRARGRDQRRERGPRDRGAERPRHGGRRGGRRVRRPAGQLIRGLAEDIGATVQFSAAGGATVFIGGHAAVSQGHARQLTVTTAASGAPQVNLCGQRRGSSTSPVTWAARTGA